MTTACQQGLFQRTAAWLMTILITLLMMLPASNAQATPLPDSPERLQFTSAGHGLGFEPAGMAIATDSYVLRITFVNANAVTPQRIGTDRSGLALAAPPLTRVVYSNLWDGVTLTYDASGIVRSTYHLAPYADPSTIRLHYSHRAQIQADGSLSIALAGEVLTESAPIAWQELGGQRVPVAVTFKPLNATEIGFALGAYDPAHPLFIDPTVTWQWENPLPQGNSLNGVACPSTTLCKTVGANGTILSWNGTTWSIDTSGTTNLLHGVTCPSTTLCKAVGNSGTILSWNGTTWSAESSGTTSSLFSVACPSVTLCKAVSNTGVLLSWNGTTWSTDTSTPNDLRGVACPSSTRCIAVGTNGTILSWNGTTWSPNTSGTTNTLNGVACPSTTLCKTIGGSGTLLSWNGTTWSADTSGTTSSLFGVACISTTLCQAVSDTGVSLSWNGTTWSTNPSGTTISLRGVACPSTTLCKAVGDNGILLSWNGATWSADSNGTTISLRSVACPSTTLCKAVGGSGTVLSWNGTTWSADSSGITNILFSVACPSATVCKAVGSAGTIRSWNGTTWSADSNGTPESLFGVACPSTTLCKAVGNLGRILSWNGTTWSADTSGTTNTLNGVACASTTLCKAVGNSGTILSWDGTTWSADTSGTTVTLSSVACPSTALCKAVGNTILSWNGTTWTANITGSQNLRGVACPSATLCKAVGVIGRILSWDGTTWTVDTSGTQNLLIGVACPSATRCKAVGDGGTILGWNETSPEIDVQGNSVSIASGDTTPSTTDNTDFGSTQVGGSAVVRTFTIQNTGAAALILSGANPVSVSGANASDFTITQPAVTSIAAGGNTTFQLTFTPSAAGVRTATVTIANNDSDEGSYTFMVQGTATPTNTPTTTPTNTPMPPTTTPTDIPTNTPVTPTTTPTDTPTNTPVPPTTTPTTTPTDTPTATSTPTGPTGLILLSSNENGAVAGVSYRDEDIIAYNLTTNQWFMVFDGSNVGLGNTDIDDFALLANGSLLLSLEKDLTLAGFGPVGDEDVLAFTPTSLGLNNTRGTYSLYFDGSQYGLEASNDKEDIKALDLDGSGNLLISPRGPFNALSVKGENEDLLTFANAAWTWRFDGSDVKLSPDLRAVWVEPTSNDLYLAVDGSFKVTGSTGQLSGDGNDIFICQQTGFGANTVCQFILYKDMGSLGLGKRKIDGLAIGALPTTLFPAGLQAGGAIQDEVVEVAGDDLDEPSLPDSGESEPAETNQLFLPLITR